MEELPKALAEIESIEVDDAHHDFGGPENNQGSDFAHFWLIVRLLDVETAGVQDYMFVCEYVQDVAEFDSSSSPTSVMLYQLKKKAGGHWGTADLTGQTQKTKEPSSKKPLVKLYKSVQAFKELKARGAFVSNAKYSVPLRTKLLSTKAEQISLAELDDIHCNALRAGLGGLTGILPESVDLDLLEMRSVPLSVDDLHRHTTGIMFSYLEQKAADHANQASALVDTIYLKLRGAARKTNVSKTWAELVERRGFGKVAFKSAVQALKAIPDAHREHVRLLDKLAKDWSTPKTIKVRMALAGLYRDKVLLGDENPWHIEKAPVRAICMFAVDQEQSDAECFLAVVDELQSQLPALSAVDISALAIYEMIESWMPTAQTLASS